MDILLLRAEFQTVPNISLKCLPLPSGDVSLLLRQMFEQHQASNPVEDMVKGAASGDVGRVEQLLEEGACGVDDQFNGKTALQAAAQNGHIDVVRMLIRYNANLEEVVSASERRLGIVLTYGDLT